MELPAKIQAAIADAAARVCIGTLPSGAIAESLRSAAEQGLMNGMTEPQIIRELEALQP